MSKLTLHTEGWTCQTIHFPARILFLSALVTRTWLSIALWALVKCGWTEMDMLVRSDLESQPIDMIILYRNETIRETFSSKGE